MRLSSKNKNHYFRTVETELCEVSSHAHQHPQAPIPPAGPHAHAQRIIKNEQNSNKIRTKIRKS